MINIYKYFSKFVILCVFLLILGVYTFAQNKRIPESVQFQIDNYESNAMKNRNSGNDNAAAGYLNKVAFLYWEYFVYDEAIKRFQEVLKINQDIGNKTGEKKVLDNMAFVYSDMERYDKAVECFSKSHEFYLAGGNKKEIAQSISNVAVSYNNNGQAKEAVSNAEKGLELSKALNDVKLMRSFYGILYESYDKLGDKEKSIKYFGLYSSMDKHIQQKQFQEKERQNQVKMTQIESEKDEAITQKEQKEEELKYTQDTLKQRQLAIDLLNAENAAKEANIKAKEAKLQAERRLRYFLVIIFIVLAVFAYYVYMQMQAKKRANAKLQELFKDIEKKNHQILDSINYASHIQEAILPYQQSISEEIENSFVLYKPKDIVSGDFYWYSKHEDKIFIAAIDCTGHGVPGAFMSMIGNTLLNEIVNERKITKPAKVLSLLNEKVMFTLNQDNHDQEGFSEDGMDITFCTYDKKMNKLELALANHTACIFKDGKMEAIEGDIFSIGGNVGDFKVEYTNHEIEIDSTVSLYMFSDGYQDQFGGPKNQKFMAGKFMKMLEDIQSQEFSKQQNIIDEEFTKWQGNTKQVDDVLVIGLQVSKQ